MTILRTVCYLTILMSGIIDVECKDCPLPGLEQPSMVLMDGGAYIRLDLRRWVVLMVPHQYVSKRDEYGHTWISIQYSVNALYY